MEKGASVTLYHVSMLLILFLNTDTRNLTYNKAHTHTDVRKVVYLLWCIACQM